MAHAVHKVIQQRMLQRAPKNPTGAHYPDTVQDVGLTTLQNSFEEGTRQGAYDHWTWPYPVAVNRYTYFNAWYGNQLPGFGKNALLAPWIYIQNQQTSEYQRNGSLSITGMSQVDSSELLRSINEYWAATDVKGRG